jgi:hypothetical protein
MMKKLDKRNNATQIFVDSNEGERTLLSSHRSSNRSPSLDFDSGSPLITETILLDQLAGILVDIFLAQESAKHSKQKSGDLLPGINKRAS